MATRKACSRCGEVKPLDEFALNRHRADGHQSYCKPCGRAMRRASYAKDPTATRRANQARARAFTRLRQAHADEYATLYAEERARGDVA